MLKYLYKLNNDYALKETVKYKLIKNAELDCYYIRSLSFGSERVVLLDNNNTFILFNKKNLIRYLNLFKNKDLFLGKRLQFKKFLYYKQSTFKFYYFLSNSNYFFSYYLIFLYLNKQALLKNSIYFLPITCYQKIHLSYYLNGFHGLFFRRNYNIFKKIYKNFKKIKYSLQVYKFIEEKSKKLLFKNLLSYTFLKTKFYFKNKKNYY